MQHSRESFTGPRRILASLLGHLGKNGGLHEVMDEAADGVERATFVAKPVDKQEGSDTSVPLFATKFRISPSTTMEQLPMD